jgi:hypothetical protein
MAHVVAASQLSDPAVRHPVAARLAAVVLAGALLATSGAAWAGASSKSVTIQAWLSKACPVVQSFGTKATALLNDAIKEGQKTKSLSQEKSVVLSDLSKLVTAFQKTRSSMLAAGTPNNTAGQQFANSAEGLYKSLGSNLAGALTKIKKLNVSSVSAFDRQAGQLYTTALNAAVASSSAAERKAFTPAIKAVADALPACKAVGL